MNYIKGNDTKLEPFPVAIIVSRFNSDVTTKLLSGALEQLNAKGFSDEWLTVVEVPGAVEIPIVAKRLAQKKQYRAIICLGAVIRGETSHYDYVCSQVSEGAQKVSLKYELPVIFGVLTTDNLAQAMDRVGGQHGHKGKDAVDAAIEMVQVLSAISD